MILQIKTNNWTERIIRTTDVTFNFGFPSSMGCAEFSMVGMTARLENGTSNFGQFDDCVATLVSKVVIFEFLEEAS